LLRKLIAIVVLILPGIAQADIYAFSDESGVTHFSNVPDDDRYQIYLRTPKPVDETQPITGGNQRTLSLGNQRLYGQFITQAASANRIDAALLHAVISAESGYNPNALSRKGAAGLMQLMPDTARRYGVTNPYDPAQNIQGGARYLRDLLLMFNNDIKLALAAYNAGEKKVVRYGNRIPPFRETIQYVPRVLAYYRKYQATALN
jgi:soluble lytic murein transglycosylase-like protein